MSFSRCNNKTKTSERGSITIILRGFTRPPDKVKLGVGIFASNTSTVFNIWDMYKMTKVDAENIKPDDTLNFMPKDNFLLIQHQFKGISKTDYLLRRGDTLQITFNNGIPAGRLINHTEYPYDNIISQKLRDISIADSSNYTAFEYYTQPLIGLSIYDKNITSLIKSRKSSSYYSARRIFLHQIALLKEYRDKNLISDEIFLMFSNRAYYLLNLMEIQQNRLSDDLIKKAITDNVYPFHNMPYSFLQVFLEGYVQKKILPTVELVESSNAKMPDYREVYTRIENDSTFFKGVSKDLLLYKYLKLINENFSGEEFKSYANRFIKNTRTSFLKQEISNDYSFNSEKLKVNNNDTYLINYKKEKLTLKSILSNNRNKLIYIDFWASWCLPCRDAMPNSKKLREEYRDKDIAFVYISLDKSFENWQRASAEEDIKNFPESYLALDFSASDYFNSLNIKAIPRYLLFNFQGDLEWTEAPGPASKSLQLKIEQLLKKK